MDRTSMLKKIAFVVAFLAYSGSASFGFSSSKDAPWWEQGKIRFFWGQWSRFGSGSDPLKRAPIEEVMSNLRAMGATVFVDDDDTWFTSQLPGGPYAEGGASYKANENPRFFKRGIMAKAHGLKYFVPLKVCYNRNIAERVGARLAVNRYGRTSPEEVARGMQISFGTHVPCPLDEKVAEEWLLKPALMAARSGHVDGLNIDWESYGGTEYDQTAMGEYLCYCDACFADFIAGKSLTDTVPRADRYDWLLRRGLHHDYLKSRRDALTNLYRRVADQVHRVKRDFVFSAYPQFAPGEWEWGWRLEGAALGLHAPSAPFFVIDPSYYNQNHDAPWWESSYSEIKKLGMKHILGSWTGGLFGEQPALDVSAAEWMYEAAMSHDGVWIWFEHRFGPTDYTAFRAAEKRIASVENKAGDLLTKGVQDNTFVGLVEQSGDPVFEHKIQQRSYHLGKRHLVWVFNANSEDAVDVLVHFPRLPKGQRWSVTDLQSGLAYTHGGSAVWTSGELARGLLLVIEKRSDAWLAVAPLVGAGKITGRSLAADVIHAHPDRPDTGQLPPTGSTAVDGFPVVYIKQNQRDLYRGSSVISINPVAGASLHMIDAAKSDSKDRLLFDIDGYCRVPSLSPDRTRVAFSVWVNGKGQIHVINADGSSPRNISGNDSCDTWPVWSPNGQRLAFLSDRDGDWDLYVMDADGGSQRRLTNSPGAVRHPAWSPDGRHIAFVSDRDGNFDLYCIDADGTGERRLLDRGSNIYEPVWSPDGHKIACTVGIYGFYRDIMVVDAQTGALDQPLGLTYAARGWFAYTNIRSISWSHDGKRLTGAFERLGGWQPSTQGTSGIFVATLGKPTAVSAGVTVVPGEVSVPSTETAGLKELISVEPLKLKPGGAVEDKRYNLVGGWYWAGNASRNWLTRKFDSVKWSSDGKIISFRSDMDPSGYDFLYSVPASGGKVVRLDDTLSPIGGDVNKPISLGLGAAYKNDPVAQGQTAVLAETPQFWMFREDPDKVGEAEKWFAPSTIKAEPQWSNISTHDFWDKVLGTKEKPNYIGDGWYAVEMVIPNAQGRKVWLYFGAVDENYTLWINGRYIGDNLDAGLSMWDQPVSVEITGKVNEGQSNYMVVRVRNAVDRGGIWKPVRVLVEKE